MAGATLWGKAGMGVLRFVAPISPRRQNPPCPSKHPCHLPVCRNIFSGAGHGWPSVERDMDVNRSIISLFIGNCSLLIVH